MARKTREGRCRNCGDVAGTDPETFKPMAYCLACAAPAPKAAAFNRRAARLADRETVRTVAPVALCDVCGDKALAAGYRHDTCADIVEQGGDWPVNMG